jgi:hypothetical protein
MSSLEEPSAELAQEESKLQQNLAKTEEEEKPSISESSKLTDTDSSEEPKTTVTKIHEKTVTKKKKAKNEYKDKKAYVMMYGITTGPAKCDICTIANYHFKTNKWQQYFDFHYTNATKPAARKVARQQHIDEMPYFKYKTPEDNDFKYIVGWNSVDWEEIMDRMKK